MVLPYGLSFSELREYFIQASKIKRWKIITWLRINRSSLTSDEMNLLRWVKLKQFPILVYNISSLASFDELLEEE